MTDRSSLRRSQYDSHSGFEIPDIPTLVLPVILGLLPITNLGGIVVIAGNNVKPISRYDMRKIFALTPLRTFSDSPGAIYPALQRLEEGWLIRGKVQDGSGLRRRKIYRLSADGVIALKKWLSKPVTSEDVIRGMDELLLRFAFMDLVIEKSALIEFLRALERELTSYVPTLREYLKSEQSKMPMSGRLALENGIRGYEAQLRWARDALATYGSKEPGG